MFADIFPDHHCRGALKSGRYHGFHGVLAEKFGLGLHNARKNLSVLLCVLVLRFEQMIKEPFELIVFHPDKRRSGRLSINFTGIRAYLCEI